MINLNSFPTTDEEKELYFRSEMNLRQFSALSYRLENSDIENEVLNNDYFLNRLSLSLNYSNIEVVQWLKNSWNTERILFQNQDIINNTGQSFCMQWAFPQAYYAVFGSILAMFKAIGYTESSHTAVLKKYSVIMIDGKLPPSISMCCSGIEKDFSYHNLNPPNSVTSHMELDFSKPETIEYLIGQFLRATRKLRLKEKAPKMNFRTKTGEKRKSLKKEHWEKVSNSIGATSIVDFLYRKRIKGNYQDIETYSCPFFNGKEVLNCLLHIVDRINLVNELYISKAIGLNGFTSMAEHHIAKVDNESLKIRLETINTIINACC